MPPLKNKDRPTSFKDMDAKARRDLLKAYCSGEDIEFFCPLQNRWLVTIYEPNFLDDGCYRVKTAFELRKAYSGEYHAVFDTPLKAQDLADKLGISLHCFDGYLNSVLVEDVMKAVERL